MPKGIPRNQSTQQNILHRLKIARGHLDKIIRMSEEGAYCIDIVHQSLAVQASLKAIDQIILKNHMQSCLVHSIKNGKGSEVIDEITKVFEKR